MTDIKQGDRVVKMSGVCAGKYGTVNSVSENGTLNVTFDGERLPRFCDPERCGKIGLNAKFKIGDRVWFKAPVTGAKVTAKITATLGGEKYGFVDDDGIQGTIEGNAIYPLNSRVANAKFKVGDVVYAEPGKIEGVGGKGVIYDKGRYDDYHVNIGGRSFLLPEWVLRSVNSRAANAVARNAKFADGTRLDTGIQVKKTRGLFGDTTHIGKVGTAVRVYDEGGEGAAVMVRYPGSTELFEEDSRTLVRANSR